jgi:ATP-binding cassette subfamily B protein IrtA
MKEEKKESPIGVLWGWGKPYHGKFIGSIILAVLGVACQMVPYFCVAHIVTMMLSGEQNFSRYVTAGIIALCGYFGKVLFSCLSTTISHTATYYTLRDLRENITTKLARVPMGTILDTPSGQYKTTIVDRVEGMESTFAHLIPEMTANVLVPLVIVVYLFVVDWRMALLSLVTLVVGLAVMSAGMKNYPVKWEGAVKAGKQMAKGNETIMADEDIGREGSSTDSRDAIEEKELPETADRIHKPSILERLKQEKAQQNTAEQPPVQKAAKKKHEQEL